MGKQHESHHSLAEIVEHLAHYLPAQGPIGVFVHHNTLHAFQHMPFEKAVAEAGRIFGAEPYLAETAYREAYTRGRVKQADIDAVLAEAGIDVELRRVMMMPGMRELRPQSIDWELHEGGLIESEADRQLFQYWLERTPVCEPETRLPARPMVDDEIQSLLIQLTAAYLDQGLAYWPMANRAKGLWEAAKGVLLQRAAVEANSLRKLHQWVVRWKDFTAEEAITEALAHLGIKGAAVEEYLRAELLALPGWAGMVRMLETEPELAPHEILPAKLIDYVALRLLLVVSAVDGLYVSLNGWRHPEVETAEQAEARRQVGAAQYYQVSQLLGLTLSEVQSWDVRRVNAFRESVNAFDGIERRRCWHLAYERRHERQILLPLQEHSTQRASEPQARMAAQVFFCIDEREESIRRHLEEADPDIETFGAAGFFGVAMSYRGIDDPSGVALCPVVVKPGHAIVERPAQGYEETHGKRRALRKFLGRMARAWFVSSRTLVRGWLGTSVLGIFSLFPLTVRVLSPRVYSRFSAWLNESVLPEPRTELAFMRTDQSGHQAVKGLLPGYSTQEKIDIVARVLGPAGLRQAIARLVVVLGHGSTTVNNPHESAYDCGACGGRRGGPNARLFAAMANRPDVRTGLRERGISIPEDTWFVGGYHDTCNDQIDLYDLEDLPKTHVRDVERLRHSLDEARARSAHERTRRFELAEGMRTPLDGLRHVQERAEHLAEPRPEYGHGTNAVAIVGRRSTTHGLFLDRRSFLISYDAMQDPQNAGLAAVLGAVIPVCGGISLEYYFSTVDNERYGCGTKLPHNVTGLLGVMNGFEGDLRTGLALQTVEIHEPVRILFVVETTPERLLATIHASPALTEWLENQWIRMAVMNPEQGGRIFAYRGAGKWDAMEGDDEKLFEVGSSREWYEGHIEHLPMARIEPKVGVRS